MLYQWLSREAERRAENVSSVIQAALEQHVEQHAQPFDLTKTRTWELCGAFTVAEPEAEYIVDPDETESPVTNYAEHVDDVLSEIIVDTSALVAFFVQSEKHHHVAQRYAAQHPTARWIILETVFDELV